MLNYVSPGLLIINFFFLIRYYRKLKSNKTIIDDYERNKEKLSNYIKKNYELKNKNFDMTYFLKELKDENNNLKNDIYSKDQKIYELIDEINDLKNKIEVEEEVKEEVDDNIQVEDKIIPFIESEFGEGLIRLSENGIYYHGVCDKEKQKWNKNNECCRQIYEYKYRDKNKHNLDKYNTFNIDSFCNNCLLIKDNYNYKIFECQGHQY